MGGVSANRVPFLGGWGALQGDSIHLGIEKGVPPFWEIHIGFCN